MTARHLAAEGQPWPAGPPELAGLTGFAQHIVRWQASHGRSQLPWQHTQDPYRVWLSEIMLQQTQVATVLGYYGRFLERFPDVQALAVAPQDDVLALWSGLGYYSRARNLHRCAQQVMQLHGGAFPRSAQALAPLPGIGRSTAAAIAAFCFGERAAILDGNVKRVLARVLAFDGDLASTAQERQLWALAEAMLPHEGTHMPAYTQGLMDLGATVCLVRKPSCLMCPVQDLCRGRAQGRPEALPVKTRKLRRSAAALWLLHATRGDGAVWLEKRPDTGVWAGLYCLPAFEERAALAQAIAPAALTTLQDDAPFVHVLTHKDLHLHPVRALLAHAPPDRTGDWFLPARLSELGLPAPIRKLLAAAPAD